jgi:hypothetical protein
VIVATTPYLAGYRVTEVKGQVFGLVVRSRGFAGNFAASLRSIVGGEIHEYTELLENTRRQALDRMVKNATSDGRQRCRSLDALRLVRDRQHDVRDRGLRNRRRGRARMPAPAESSRHRRIVPDRPKRVIRRYPG